MSGIEIHTPAKVSDAIDLAKLHKMTLPSSTPLVAGTIYLRRYYRFLINSPKEFVLVARDPRSTAVAAAVVSLSPETLARRALVATSQIFVAGILLSIFIGPHWKRKRVLQMFRAVFSERPYPLSSPELVYLYVADHARSRGLGKSLTQAVKNELRTRGYDKIYVSTIDATNNTALHFYEHNGFSRLAQFRRLGCQFCLLSANLNDLN